MKIDQNIIKDILMREHYIKAEDAKKAEEFVRSGGGEFVDYFMREGLLTSDLFGQAMAEAFKIPYIDLNSNPPPEETKKEIPEDVAQSLRVVLIKETKIEALVATDNPADDRILPQLKKIFEGKEIKLGFSLSKDIDALLFNYKKPVIDSQKIAPEFIDEIVSNALNMRASDIHFDPQGQEVVIRFRLDGVLQEQARIPKSYYENVLNRIKVQANMKIDEHFSAQDGSIRYEVKGRAIESRVSVVPTLDGEKISIRLLSEDIKSYALEDLGLSKECQKMFLRAAKKPFGMILVTGPTGCGKTTTLYALLKHLNNSGISISTIEDPVEYKIPGVNHIQINPETNLTFAEGLKSIIRQDPDIILVGEIRDRETASIAVNAALTGHLLFSTFHANDAATVVPRFLEMGVEPSVLSSTLKLIVSQRLVKKVCEKCRQSYKLSAEEFAQQFPEAKDWFPKGGRFYIGKGCQNCSNTGFKGRTAIFEMIEVGKELEELIAKNPSAQEVWRLEKQKGAKSLFEDGIDKVKSGVTTVAELLRVAVPPEDAN